MDIAALSIAMANSQVQQQVSIKLAAEVLDTAEIQGDDLIKMMEQSVNPDIGGNIDISL